MSKDLNHDLKIDFPEREYSGYLFDCDGTLIDSMPVHYAGWGVGLAEQGIHWDFPVDLYNSLAGTATHKIIALINERFSLGIDAEALMESKRKYYTSHLDDVGLIEPVVDFARKVAETHPVAVVTGGIRPIVSASLKAKGLLDLFPVLVTAADVPNGKPAPDMFLEAARLLEVEPTGCVVFEDGELGIQGAKAAGMDAVFIPSL